MARGDFIVKCDEIAAVRFEEKWNLLQNSQFISKPLWETEKSEAAIFRTGGRK